MVNPVVTLRNIFLTLLVLGIPAGCHALDKGELNPKGCHFDDMYRFYLDELGIKQTSIEIIEKDIGVPKYKGYTRQTDKHSYLIVLALHLEPSEIRITLAHELVHVRQLENKQIRQDEFNKHYYERSFEDEAFRLSLPLAAKFYTQMDCTETANPCRDCSG